VELAFRYSKDAVDVKALRRYAAGRTIEIRSTARDVIVAISVESDGDSFDTADDGSGWLSSLIGLRADLASGDERILYLGWLLDVQSGEIDDDAVEPTRPEGLGALTPALESFIDIVGIDRDLVAASADGAPKTASRLPAREVHRWLAKLCSIRLSISLCSRASLTATPGSEPRSCTGFVSTHGVAPPPCRCARPVYCVLEQEPSQNADARKLGNIRLANARRESGRNRPPATDT